MITLKAYRPHLTRLSTGRARFALVGVALFAAGLLTGLAFLPEGDAQSARPAPVSGSSVAAPTGAQSNIQSDAQSRAASPVAMVTRMPKAGGTKPPPLAPPQTAPRTPPRAPAGKRDSAGAEGRLAIVIDDIGHNLDAVADFLALKRPLTFSILPAVPYTREAAHMIGRAGREYIIHLPMQPYDYPAQNPGPRPLLLSQSALETERRMRGYLETLPGAIGASNHMGSAFTYDRERMRVVQSVLAERNLFFLNSRTSGAPVPAGIAQRQGYRYLERDVFLDHDPGERAVRRYFDRAVRLARRQGDAIAIGHPYPTTLKVLRENLPRLSARNVRVVTLSEMLRGR